MPNWKVPAPDCVNSFWLKDFKKYSRRSWKNLAKMVRK